MRVFSFLRVSTVVILMVGCWLSCLTRLSDILPLYCSSPMYMMGLVVLLMILLLNLTVMMIVRCGMVFALVVLILVGVIYL